MLTKCNRCGIERPRVVVGKFKCGRLLHHDERGKRWVGLVCRDCNIKRKTEVARRNGKMSYDDCAAPNIRKGRESEIKVKSFFEQLGNRVTLNNLRGPDLIIETTDRKFTCEVKTVSEAKKSKNGVTLYTNAILKSAMYNDYIAYVWGDKIHITTMKEHLLNVGVNGHRTVTKLMHDKYTNISLREARKAREDRKRPVATRG